MKRLADVSIYRHDRRERYINYKIEHPQLFWIDAISHVNIGLDQPHYSNVHIIGEPSRTDALVNKYRRLDNNYIPDDLELIDERFNPEGLLLRRCAGLAFMLMCEQAYKEGIRLQAVSAFRSYQYQQEVYFRKMTPDIALEEYQLVRDQVSARPGHSEHQTGLAVDINDTEESFEATAEGKWLAVNAYKYGFILRYPKGKETITGYSYEPWHFRYLGRSLAKEVYISRLSYDEYYVRYISSD